MGGTLDKLGIEGMAASIPNLVLGANFALWEFRVHVVISLWLGDVKALILVIGIRIPKVIMLAQKGWQDWISLYIYQDVDTYLPILMSRRVSIRRASSGYLRP